MSDDSCALPIVILAGICVICIMAIEITALLQGIDGVLLSATFGTITGILGYIIRYIQNGERG